MLIIKTIFILIPFSLFSVIYLAISDSPLVEKTYTHPVEVKKAVENYKYLSNRLFYTEGDVDLTLTNNDIQSIIKAASHLVPYFNATSNMGENAIILSGTIELNKLVNNKYINTTCVLKNSTNNLIDSCYIGKLSIPGFLVKGIMNLSFSMIKQHTINDISLQIVENGIIQNNQLHIFVSKHNNLKNNIKDDARFLITLLEAFSFKKEQKLDYEVIIEYLSYFDTDYYLKHNRNISLELVFSRAFEFAKIRSQHGGEVSENTHAIFAVAIAFAHKGFINIIKQLNDKQKKHLASFSFSPAHINGRYDLTLHFLYSAIFEQISNEQFAFNIGELKELFDANKGGSKFDFSDLAADLAGAKFANFLTSNRKNAFQAQNLLAKNISSNLFFPNTRNYPKSVNSRDLERMIFANEENKYEKVVKKMHEDIRSLPLYK